LQYAFSKVENLTVAVVGLEIPVVATSHQYYLFIFWPLDPIYGGIRVTQLQDNAVQGAMQGGYSGFILWIRCW